MNEIFLLSSFPVFTKSLRTSRTNLSRKEGNRQSACLLERTFAFDFIAFNSSPDCLCYARTENERRKKNVCQKVTVHTRISIIFSRFDRVTSLPREAYPDEFATNVRPNRRKRSLGRAEWAGQREWKIAGWARSKAETKGQSELARDGFETLSGASKHLLC